MERENKGVRESEGRWKSGKEKEKEKDKEEEEDRDKVGVTEKIRKCGR